MHLHAAKIVSPEQNIHLKNSDGNLILAHRDCKLVPLVFMWLPLVLIFISSSMCPKYKGDIYAIFSWLLLVIFLGIDDLDN